MSAEQAWRHAAWGLLAALLLDTAPLAASTEANLDTAVTLYRQEGPGAALSEFERLVNRFDADGLVLQAAIARRFVGECHWRMGAFDEARAHLEQTLQQVRALGEQREEAKTLNVLGLLEWDLGNYGQAIENLQQARSAGRDLGDARLEGAALNNLSLVYDELGDYQTSLAQYEQVLALYSTADFPRGLGDTLGNIGGVYLLLGRYRDALSYYRRALAISTQLESRLAMSQDHGNIALCQLGLGETELALEHFDLAIDLARQAGMRQDEAYWMRGAANALVESGRFDRGLATFRAALAIYEDIDARPERLETLHDMGRLYLRLGDAVAAETQFRHAIAAAREMQFARGITLNLIALGDLSLRRNKLEEAATLYDQARRRAADVGEQGHHADSLLRLSLAHREQQQLTNAIEEAREALAIARSIDARPVEAKALYALAELERRRGQTKQALAGFTQATQVLGERGDPDIGWQIHYGRAKALEALGQTEAAIDALTAAVKVIESVLDRLREDRFRAGYVQDKYQVYVELVRLQLEAGRIGAAFTTSERMRARSFSMLSNGDGIPALSDDERRRERELRERIRQLNRALNEETEQASPERRQLAVASFSRELVAAEREYQAFLDDRYAYNDTAARHIPSSDDVRLQLGPGEALIEYVVGAQGVTAFVLTRDDTRATTTAVRKVDLDSRVELLRDLIRRPDSRWRKPAVSLSEVLIAPLEAAGWLDGVQHLYLIPHGMLNYLPFAALAYEDSDDTLLLDRYAMALLPSAAALSGMPRNSVRSESALVMAPESARLRYAPAEARSVDALFRPRSKLFVGDMATEGRFKDLAGNFGTVHLVTHGYFNKLNPLFSGLQFEPDDHNDGVLQVHEILELRLDAGLVTLSACETALGAGYFTEVPAGEEFVGLTRAFLSVGSDSVMATLWEVDDRSSVELMKQFYRRLSETEPGHSRSSALMAAQQALRSSQAFRHPYHWAPFVLVGRLDRRMEPASESHEETS